MRDINAILPLAPNFPWSGPPLPATMQASWLTPLATIETAGIFGRLALSESVAFLSQLATPQPAVQEEIRKLVFE